MENNNESAIEREGRIIQVDNRLYKTLSKDKFVDVILGGLNDARSYWCGTKRTVSTKTNLAYVESNGIIVPTLYQSHFWDQFPMGHGEIYLGFGALKEGVEHPNRIAENFRGDDFLNQIPGNQYFAWWKQSNKDNRGKIYEKGNLMLTGYVIDLNRLQNLRKQTREGLDLHMERIQKAGGYQTAKAVNE